MTRLPRVAGLAAVALAAVAAGFAFHRAFAVGDLAGPVVVAAILPVALVGGAERLRAGRRPLPLVATVAASALLWLVVVAVTLFRHGSPDVHSVLPAVRDGVVNGWARLLDVTLPAQGDPDLLVVPQALTWLAAAAGAELVARTRTTLLPVLPAVAAFVVGIAMTVPAPGSDVSAAAVLAVAGGILAVARRVERQAGPATSPASSAARGGGYSALARALAAGAPIALVVAAVGFAAGPALPPVNAHNPYDLRAHRSQPQHDQSGTSPLDEVSAWLGQRSTVLFTVRGPAPGDLRLAVLDRFDGQTWTSSARYTPAGTAVPAEPGTADGSGRIRQDITIGALDGALLPAADRPVRLAGADLAVDTNSGALLSTIPLRAGRTYTAVSSPPPDYSPAQYATLQPATGAQANADRALAPGLPAVVRQLAQKATANGRTPLQRAYLLQQYLRGSFFTYSAAAPPGHTYGHIAAFLSSTKPTGTSEQFAATYALAARVIGLPSRLVVGFRVTGKPSGGAYAVTGATAYVWPEIDFAGAGWIAFDPTPKAAKNAAGQVATAGQGQTTERAQKIAQAVSRPAPAQAPVAAPAPAPAHHSHVGRYVAAAAVGLIALLVVAYLAVVLGLPPLRRFRRRRAATPRQQVVGAWAEALDDLRRAGVEIPDSATPEEVVARGAAAQAGRGTGASDGGTLGPLADLARAGLFSPRQPGDEQAAAAWRHANRLRADLRHATPVGRRLAGHLRPPVRVADAARTRSRATAGAGTEGPS